MLEMLNVGDRAPSTCYQSGMQGRLCPSFKFSGCCENIFETLTGIDLYN